jgi:hypothetical protein
MRFPVGLLDEMDRVLTDEQKELARRERIRKMGGNP